MQSGGTKKAALGQKYLQRPECPSAAQMFGWTDEELYEMKATFPALPFASQAHISPAERLAFRALLCSGLLVFTNLHSELATTVSWWREVNAE